MIGAMTLSSMSVLVDAAIRSKSETVNRDSTFENNFSVINEPTILIAANVLAFIVLFSVGCYAYQ